MTTKLGKSDAEHVAKLTKLPVSSGELTKFGEQLTKIVEHVGRIGKLKTQMSKVKTTTQNLKILREDKKQWECFTQEEAVSNAKNVHNGLFVVPAIFGE